MENIAEKNSHIKERDIDYDPRNEPTYPMKDYTGDDHKRLNYERPEQQPQNMSGISGLLRRFALKYSESSFGHWFPLIFADRINIWEGFLKNFRTGMIPGLKSELKYNKKKFIRRTAIKTVVSLIVFAVVMGSKKRKKARS